MLDVNIATPQIYRWARTEIVRGQKHLNSCRLRLLGRVIYDRRAKPFKRLGKSDYHFEGGH